MSILEHPENPLATDMTLRDFFARGAVEALLLIGKEDCMHDDPHGLDPCLIAEQAYEVADAMLAQRMKRDHLPGEKHV